MIFYDLNDVKAAADCRALAISDLRLKVINGRCAAVWRGGDNAQSVQMDKDGWYDHGAKEGGSVLDLYMRARGWDIMQVAEHLGKLLGLQPRASELREAAARRMVCEYIYTDAAGEPVHKTIRYEPKSFSQAHWDGKEWQAGLNGCKTYPYRLPEWKDLPAVMLAEGEKDADSLVAVGAAATTLPMGAEKWDDGFAPWFAGKSVIICRDNDEPGRKHAALVSRKLLGVAKSVKIINPAAAREGCKDVTDWLAAGGTKDELLAMIDATPCEAAQAEAPEPGDMAPVTAPAEPAETQTETGNARRLVKMFGADLRYVFESRAWFVWTGTHWEQDSHGLALARTSEVAEAIRKEALSMYAESDEARARQVAFLKWGNRSLSEGTRANGLKLAACEPGQTIVAADFDKDGWLVNVANGTLDLRKRKLRKHTREDLQSYCLPTEYKGGTSCDRWIKFLDEIFQGDAEVIEFIQRAAGYSLTAETREQVVFILFGHGANGKSVFLSVLRHVLGPLARHASIETFTSRDNYKIPEDRARLRGARFVTCSESAHNQKLDESFVKDATGGEPITARKLHENSIEFKPTFKLWLATNHKPEISGTDEAIWRRVRLVPFFRYFPPEARDPELLEKLKAESAGILAWMADGCRKWQDKGLGMPKAVETATAEYRSESDAVGQWIEECCEVARELSGMAKDLFSSYEKWCRENGLRDVNARNFGLALKERGYTSRKSTGGRNRWSGLALSVATNSAETDHPAEPSGNAELNF